MKGEVKMRKVIAVAGVQVALFAAAYFLRKKTEDPLCSCRKVLLGAGGISFLIYTSVEIFHNLKIHECTYHFRHGGLSVWWAVLAVLLIAEGIRKNGETGV